MLITLFTFVMLYNFLQIEKNVWFDWDIVYKSFPFILFFYLYLNFSWVIMSWIRQPQEEENGATKNENKILYLKWNVTEEKRQRFSQEKDCFNIISFGPPIDMFIFIFYVSKFYFSKSLFFFHLVMIGLREINKYFTVKMWGMGVSTRSS